MTLLGPNLDQLQKLCGGTLTLKTTLLISLQILDRIELLHQHGFLHNDIKPDNFLMGLNNDSPFVFMIDFGRCKRFRSKNQGQHINYKENVYQQQNSIFASINAHNNIQTSRRDDI